jgi:voltage-gated potassium channel
MSARRQRLRELYFGSSQRAVHFQAVMLVLDVALIAFFIASPFLEKGTWFLVLDYCIAAVLAADLAARAWSYGNLRRWILRPLVWADIAVLISLLVPVAGANLGFLRILRAYSLVHGQALWRVLGGGRWMNTDVVETTRAITNLLVFVFIMTGLVHAGFAARVPAVRSYWDSLYFTVTSLTTTGYGDITLPGVGGRLLSIIIMIGGVSLFFRLVQVTIRPSKVRYECKSCGMMRHEVDAVHCKACGALLKIRDDND